MSGDEADQPAAGARIFDIGHSFKFFGATKVSYGVDKLLY